jgi:hypothetical protein
MVWLMFGTAQTKIQAPSRIFLGYSPEGLSAMTDVYVYNFNAGNEPASQRSSPMRFATLAAIKNIGTPILESQLVVDHSELGDDGFLLRFGDGLNQIDDLWTQIRSLNLRATSRDTEALSLIEGGDGPRRYLLSLESRELRREAQRLSQTRMELVARKLDCMTTDLGFGPFVGVSD